MNKINIGQTVYTGSFMPYETGVKFYVDKWIVLEFNNNDVWLQPFDKKHVAVIREISIVYNNIDELYNKCKYQRLEIYKNRIDSLKNNIEELNKDLDDTCKVYELIINHRLTNEEN